MKIILLRPYIIFQGRWVEVSLKEKEGCYGKVKVIRVG